MAPSPSSMIGGFQRGGLCGLQAPIVTAVELLRPFYANLGKLNPRKQGKTTAYVSLCSFEFFRNNQVLMWTSSVFFRVRVHVCFIVVILSMVIISLFNIKYGVFTKSLESPSRRCLRRTNFWARKHSMKLFLRFAVIVSLQ